MCGMCIYETYGQGHEVEGQLHKGKFCRSRSQGRNDQLAFLNLGFPR